ncbi:hypothetical protein E4U42_003621 [Claviceps africana]|uniref:Ubiquitination network signaling protein n=1 Tax=Claviceps africana TaxID=83212 RepID=A0A8K0JC82_9HYPO|nr:hypothetical protein E4U42_003621 [Claviceps africana]
MPRASGPGKRQQGATTTHRESRHENGLVSPAKRGSSRKSNGQLDGSARSLDQVAGYAGPSTSPPPVPLGQHNGTLSVDAFDAAIDGPSCNPRRRSSLGTSSEASSESVQSHTGPNGGAPMDAEHRQIDVNAMKNIDVHRDSGPLEFAATVIRSLPMQDTLAILIILMHVPYVSLSLIYACFALITFVPPVTTKTGMNINLAEILDGSSHATSLATILCMDFFFFLIWVFLWQPIQDGILEFAKPVIAITLGGGTNAKDGTSRGVTTCFTWILLHQAIRATKSHWAKFTRHFPASWPLPVLLSESFESKPIAYDKRSTHGWIQSTLAMHILTQGIVRFVREWYLKREKANAVSGVADPESGKSPSLGISAGTTSAWMATSHALDSCHDGGSNAADTETSTSHAPSTTTASSNKRRRKQSAQVRLEQPLWAAFASSKIVAIKEFELSQWGRNPNSSSATDRHNLGSASFDSQPRQIWISYIGSDEVCFNTSYFPYASDRDISPAAATGSGPGDLMPPAGVDASKPFYVRINNAFWQPTRIIAVQSADEDEALGTRWTGDIYGLRPASTYVCEFVDIQSGEVIHSSAIRTAIETLRENDSLPPPVPLPGQPQLRPDSPATIIRNSIAAEEARLADERSRLKTLRKESKAKLNAIRREIELVDNQLLSAGNSDERHRQKIRQHEIQKIQAERDTESLGDQLDKLDSLQELADRKVELDKSYAEEKKLFDAAQRQFEDYTANLDREVKTKELERVNLNSRRNKIGFRIDKVDKELRNISDANRRGLGEADRRDQERASWLENNSAIKNNYLERIAQACSANASRNQQIQNLQTQLSTLNNTFIAAAAAAAVSNTMEVSPGGAEVDGGHGAFRQHPSTVWNANPAVLPPFSASMWANSSGDVVSSAGAPAAQAGSSSTTWQPPPTAAPFEPRATKCRGRSSSMLSNVSGFTELSDDDSFLRSPAGGLSRSGMNYSQGNGTSGSGGSTGSGSIGDSRSPR